LVNAAVEMMAAVDFGHRFSLALWRCAVANRALARTYGPVGALLGMLPLPVTSGGPRGY
jgi:hypothetical protein